MNTIAIAFFKRKNKKIKKKKTYAYFVCMKKYPVTKVH